MRAFTQLTSVAAPLWVDGVETDMIIPAAMCVRPAGADYGDALLAPWRYLADGSDNPEFVLNREPYRRAEILVTGSNFGFGSSREHAAWAVRDFGLRAIIAVSFASIFRSNCMRNGVLAISLPTEVVQAIVDEISTEPTELSIDLEQQIVVTPSGGTHTFDVPPLEKAMLVEGLDELGLVARFADERASFEARDRTLRPWVYETLSSAS
jgi:3-isopropylmalate/(R)-2-methylmalate dehydratase small subunit